MAFAGPTVNKAVLLQMQDAAASKEEMKVSPHAMQMYENLSYEDTEKKIPIDEDTEKKTPIDVNTAEVQERSDHF